MLTRLLSPAIRALELKYTSKYLLGLLTAKS